MSLTRLALDRPYAVLALLLVIVVLGLFAFWQTPTDLFPDSVPPQVLVITVEPGASAGEVHDKITQILEKEINTLEGLKRVVSTSRDEVSSISAEFVYEKPIGEAIVDVLNAVARVRGTLPGDIQEPLIYQITDATRPILTLAVRPRPGSLKTLADVRLLAENDLKDFFLAVPGVADVEVFGGHQPEVTVRVDRDALSARKITLPELLSRLAEQNVTSPAGVIYSAEREYLAKISGEFSSTSSISLLPIASTQDGSQVKLGDVAQVELGESDLRSFYHGNGQPAIALNLLRAHGGNTVEAIHAAKQALSGLEQIFPDLEFAITDDQQPIIDVNLRGMRTSLFQAVVLTVLVIFIFLADVRAAAVASVSIPLSFLTTMIVLWSSPHTLNMVTLSGLIVAVGMVVDASVVVLENIYRHYSSNVYTAGKAAVHGAEEVSLAITAGMFTTVVVLVPVMFTQGYTARVMGPLNLTIIATLVASLVISLTVIPLVARRILGRSDKKKSRVETALAPVGRGVERLADRYVAAVRLGLRYRWISLLLILGFLILTARLIPPLLGSEQMPPMDTGTVIVEFDTDASAKPEQVEDVLSEIEHMIYATPGVTMVSAVAGSEPGAVSFGSGGTTSQAVRLTVNLVDRTRRDETIWEIEELWREQLRQIEGVRTYRVSEYGATPVSTTKAPSNLILSGPDAKVLDRLADEVIRRLRGTPGLVDLRRSWYLDKEEVTVTVDPALARLYETSPQAVAFNLRAAVQGIPATQFRLAEFLDIPVRVRYRAEQINDSADLGEVMIPSRLGLVPLRALASVETRRVQPSITRENLKPTIDITGGNVSLTIGQVTDRVLERLSGLELPAGYELTVAGTSRDMQESQAEMGTALLIGIALLYILLLSLFHSFVHPLTIMAAVPLAAAGALWGLLLFDKPMCMPALMGIILLGGTIVNNSILLVDFILKARKNGMTKEQAIVESVRLRLRPILMTATSTIVGLSPLIFEMAVGLERMSPLGIAAGTGLLVGTVVTTVAVPILYSLMDSISEWLRRLFTGADEVAEGVA